MDTVFTPTFEDIKREVTSSPVLARYIPLKSTFLKTNWSAEVMGWILMQPADGPISLEATKVLYDGGPCLFNVSKKRARFLPISFGS